MDSLQEVDRACPTSRERQTSTFYLEMQRYHGGWLRKEGDTDQGLAPESDGVMWSLGRKGLGPELASVVTDWMLEPRRKQSRKWPEDSGCRWPLLTGSQSWGLHGKVGVPNVPFVDEETSSICQGRC